MVQAPRAEKEPMMQMPHQVQETPMMQMMSMMWSMMQQIKPTHDDQVKMHFPNGSRQPAGRPLRSLQNHTDPNLRTQALVFKDHLRALQDPGV